MKKFNYNLNIINKKYYIDSRDVKENSAFICLKGNNNDGHKFINYVLKNFKKTIVIGEKNSKYTKNFNKNIKKKFCVQSTKNLLIRFSQNKKISFK